MPITIECPECEEELSVPSSAAGKKVRCPECKAVVRVPIDNAEEETPPPKRKKAPVPDDEDRPRKKRSRRDEEEDDDDDEDDEEYDEPQHPRLKGSGPNIPPAVWVAYGLCALAVNAGIVFAVIQIKDSNERAAEAKRQADAEAKNAKLAANSGQGGGGSGAGGMTTFQGEGFKVTVPRPMDLDPNLSKTMSDANSGDFKMYATGGPSDMSAPSVLMGVGVLVGDPRGGESVEDCIKRIRAKQNSNATGKVDGPRRIQFASREASEDRFLSNNPDQNSSVRTIYTTNRYLNANGKVMMVTISFGNSRDDNLENSIFDSFELSN